jgi:hypothetical protein
MIRCSFILLLIFFFASPLNAQNRTTEIGIQSDNDSYLFQGSDRYYTDGIFIYFRKALKISNDTSTKLANKVLGFEAGQKLFNPYTGNIKIEGYDRPQVIDRPFAAYLYVGSTLNLLYNNESNLKIGAQIGVIGPNALGKQTQDFVHDNFGFYHPNGWEYQINNELQLNLSFEYNQLILRRGWFDASFTSYANLGNGFTGAGIGPLLRIGNLNQLFNSISTASVSTQNTKIKPLQKNELFFYYKPLINYVIYDATIQGGLFDNGGGLEVTKTIEPFVVSQKIGLAFNTNRFIFDTAVIFHTKDDKEMTYSQQWLSISLMYRLK